MTAAAAPAPERYRMRDLCRLTGLERQAIHFYIKEGLLPPGEKTGRNTAWYDASHVERLQLIRKLQHERFLPLKAIRALLDESEQEDFSPDQQRFLAEIRDTLPDEWRRARPQGAWVDADTLLARTGVEPAELAALITEGFVESGPTGDRGQATLAEGDVWRVEAWGAFRRAGFTEALGFAVADLHVFEDVMSELVRREAELLMARLAGAQPDVAGDMVLAALPVVHDYMTRLHEANIRKLLATTGPNEGDA